MKTQNLLIIISIIAILGCNKDKETEELQWNFSVESLNNENLSTVEIGKEINLQYILKKEYNAGASINYEIEANDSNFKLINDKGEELELNKAYSLEKDTLKLNYTSLSKGEKNIKILFKNSKGHKVEKEISFFVDGFGFYIVPSSTETVIRDYLELKYYYEGYDNKTESEFLVKIIEDEADGQIIDKNGDSFSKGDSFTINTNDEGNTLKYITKNITKNKDFEKITLEVMPKKGNSSDKKTIFIKQRFIQNKYEIFIDFPTEYVYPNQKIDFTIDIKEDFDVRRTDYVYNTIIAPYIIVDEPEEKNNFQTNNYQVGKQSYFIYNGNKYKLNEKIPLKKGKNTVSMILDKESFISKKRKYYGTKLLKTPELELIVSSNLAFNDEVEDIFDNIKRRNKTFRHNKIWFYPEARFALRESYGEGQTCDICWENNAGRNKLALLSSDTYSAVIDNTISNDYQLNIKSIDIDADNNRENKVDVNINLEDLPAGAILGHNDLMRANKGKRRFAGLYEFSILYQGKAVVTGNFNIRWGKGDEVVDVYVNTRNEYDVKNLNYIDFNK